MWKWTGHPSKTPAHLAAVCAQVRHIIAGTAARTMAQAFIHPIDTVKTRLQVLSVHQPGCHPTCMPLLSGWCFGFCFGESRHALPLAVGAK